jgi:hypothetical protein
VNRVLEPSSREASMRKQFPVVIAACVVGLALGGAIAWASGGIAVNIPFSFMVKDKEMPAGHYEIEATGSDQARLLVRSTDGKGSVVVPVIERLADTGATEPKIVFDKVGTKSYLSEVHIPGSDGFLVGIAKGKETHEVLTGKE